MKIMYLFRGSKSSYVGNDCGVVTSTPKVKHKSVDNLFASFLARSMSKRNIASPERVPRKNNEFDTPSILSRSRSNAKGLESFAERLSRSRSTARRSSDEAATESKSGRSKSTTKRNDWFRGDVGGSSRSRSTAPVRNEGAVADGGGSSRSSKSNISSTRQISTEVSVLNDVVTGAGGSSSSRSKSTAKQRSSTNNYNETGGNNTNNTNTNTNTNNNVVNVETTSSTSTAAACSRSKSTTRRTNASLDGGSYRSKSTTRRSDGADGGSSRSKSTTRRPEAQAPQETLSRSMSRRSTIPIIITGRGKPPPIENSLECTLEELLFGCVKSVVVARDVLTSNGLLIQEEEKLKIKIEPGWRQGMKITFDGNRDERVMADVIFSIVEARHKLYMRDGDDLVMSIEIPLVKALTGCNLSIPLLGGEKVSCQIDEIITPGYEKIIEDQGMPTLRNIESRGDLRIKFHVAFPGKLTRQQRSGLFSLLTDSC